MCDVYCQTVTVTRKQLESGCLTPLLVNVQSQQHSLTYLGITTCFWEVVTSEYKKIAVLITWKTFSFFFQRVPCQSAHLTQSDLTKWWCPGLQHIYFSLIQMSWFWLPGHCLFLLIYQTKSCICCTSTPQTEQKILSQKKTPSQAIKPYLFKVLEERETFAFRNYSF